MRLTDSHHNWWFSLGHLYRRIKPRKRLVRSKAKALVVPQAIDHVWSMDFMRDSPEDSRSPGLFNVIDDFSGEASGIEVDLAPTSECVIRTLKQIISWRGKPQVIPWADGSENISGLLQNWARDGWCRGCLEPLHTG
jgi:putative transposase